VLDLFAGSGSLGLEALSRGARHVRFVERGAAALDALRSNVRTLGVRGRTTVVADDALKPASWGPAADLVFLDPPYAILEQRRGRMLEIVARLVGERLRPGGVVVLHTPRDALSASDVATLGARVRRYGTNDVWFLEAGPG
jgi:16S rRNA (guanine966-N2)-methyltransferase